MEYHYSFTPQSSFYNANHMFSMNTFASVFGIAVVEAWQAAPAGGP